MFLTTWLAWLGRLGMIAVAGSLVAGLALPMLSDLTRPLLTPAVFGLLVIAFSRVPVASLRQAARRPMPIVLTTIWVMIVIPGLVAFVLYATPLWTLAPGLALGIFLMSAAPPVASSPAFASMLGLDADYSLALVVLCMVLTPISGPLYVALIAGEEMSVDPVLLANRLFWLMAGACLIASAVRKAIGFSTLARNGDVLNGINVILLFIFIIALMGDASLQLIQAPFKVTAIVLLTFAIAVLLLALSLVVLARLGRVRALTAALAASNRNMGLMPAAIGGVLPQETWLWFALAQFPIYLLPLFVRPLARAALRHAKMHDSQTQTDTSDQRAPPLS